MQVVNLHKAKVCAAGFSQQLPKHAWTSVSFPSLPGQCVHSVERWSKADLQSCRGWGRCTMVAWHSAAASPVPKLWRDCLLLCSAGPFVHPLLTCLTPKFQDVLAVAAACSQLWFTVTLSEDSPFLRK